MNFEVWYTTADGSEYCAGFEDLESAVDFAESAGSEEIWSGYDVYSCCPICGEWSCEIQPSGLCRSCHQSGIAHGF